MNYLRIKNWDKFQHYKDDRPVRWIKLHLSLLDDYEFEQLTELTQLHLLKIWILAATHKNKIPNDEKWISKKIGARSKVDILQLLELGCLEPYETVRNRTSADTKPYDASLEKEKYKEEKERACAPTGSRFDEWYEKYPKKKGKVEAQKTWKRKKLDVIADQIIADTVKRAEVEWTDPQFIPMASTYIFQERWEDEITPAPLIVPADDNKMMAFAEENGLSKPGSASNWQYRQILEGEIREGRA